MNPVIVTVTSTVWPSVTKQFQLDVRFTACTRLDYTYNPDPGGYFETTYEYTERPANQTIQFPLFEAFPPCYVNVDFEYRIDSTLESWMTFDETNRQLYVDILEDDYDLENDDYSVVL